LELNRYLLLHSKCYCTKTIYFIIMATEFFVSDGFRKENIKINEAAKVKDLKFEIEKIFGTPESKLFIYFNGSLLADSNLLQNCGIIVLINCVNNY
jgi:hypothetical protein